MRWQSQARGWRWQRFNELLAAGQSQLAEPNEGKLCMSVYMYVCDGERRIYKMPLKQLFVFGQISVEVFRYSVHIFSGFAAICVRMYASCTILFLCICMCVCVYLKLCFDVMFAVLPQFVDGIEATNVGSTLEMSASPNIHSAVF